MTKQPKTKWKKLGVCAIDSGNLIVADPCYLLPYDEQDASMQAVSCVKDIYDTMVDKGGNYAESGQVCFRHGGPGAGVAVHSPWGDGVFELYGKIDRQERIHAIFLSFDGKKPPAGL